MTIDAPVAPKKPAGDQALAGAAARRAALRRAARAQQAASGRRRDAAAAAAQAPDRNPYADPAAPYKADRLASPKFSEPIVNTPKTITVLTKELLEDKDATSLKDVGRTTAGVTLGTGEGGNAFGDRFFIRGFDARNDVFVDGIRDPAVSVRENFFTEQIEILKGSVVDRRRPRHHRRRARTSSPSRPATPTSTTPTRRSRPTAPSASPSTSTRSSVRRSRSASHGMWQNADVAERDFTTDDRGGGLPRSKWTPNDSREGDGELRPHQPGGRLPDFGVPYDTVPGAPVTSLGVPRDTYYGFVNRDFQHVQQDVGTFDAEVKLSDFVTLTTR